MNKIALLVLLSIASLWPPMAAATSLCPYIVQEMLGLRDVRIELCAAVGTAHPDCIAQDEEERGHLQGMDAECATRLNQCPRVRGEYRFRWERRSYICRDAGSSSAPDCVAAMQLEEDRVWPLIQCAMSER